MPYIYPVRAGKSSANQQNTIAIHRLTALWALAESGLGGWMHALHLPFTGLFVGGFAVVIIALIARFSHNDMRQILQATLLVMLVKFAASPQSPAPAYIAVGFQGVMGALLYRFIPWYALASVLFAVIAMVESALQKLIILTLIYGRSLWEALDSFLKGILKDLSLPKDFSFSYWLIPAYTSLYALWGLLLGVWITRLPRKIEIQAATVSAIFYREYYVPDENLSESGVDKSERKKKRAGSKLLLVVLVLAFIAAVYFFGAKDTGKAGYVVLRTIAALLLLFGIILPLVNRLLQNWLKKSSSKHKESLRSVLDLRSELGRMVKPAYNMAASRHKGFRRYTGFLFILIAITLYPAYEPTQDIHTYTGR